MGETPPCEYQFRAQELGVGSRESGVGYPERSVERVIPQMDQILAFDDLINWLEQSNQN